MKYELPSIELIVIEENNYLKFGEYLNDMQRDDTTSKLCLDDLEYVKKLQQENKQLKEVINKIESLIKSKDNGTCIHNNERRGAYTFVLNFDEAREFVWNLEDILKEVS